MSTVAIYKLFGTFRVKPEHLQQHPSGVIRHDGILLLRQETPARDDAAAIAACKSTYQLVDARIDTFGLLDPAVLKDKANHDFVAPYERALAEGSALVYYPDLGLQIASDAVVDGGFRPAAH